MVTIKSSFHDVASWLEIQRPHFSALEIEKFEQAIQIAEQYYNGQVFYPTKINLMLHSLNCAAQIASLHLYADTVVATILYALPRYANN